MHCHCGTNNRAPRWTFTDPCKPEVRPGAREESASPAWPAAPAMNARDTKKVYIRRLDIGCGPTLYRKCHSHNTPGKRHNNTWVEPLAGNCTPRLSKTNIILLSRLFTLNTPRYFLDFVSYFSVGPSIRAKSRRETPSYWPHLPPSHTPPFYEVGGPLFFALSPTHFFSNKKKYQRCHSHRMRACRKL